MDSGIDVELKGIDNPQMQGSQTAKKTLASSFDPQNLIRTWRCELMC